MRGFDSLPGSYVCVTFVLLLSGQKLWCAFFSGWVLIEVYLEMGGRSVKKFETIPEVAKLLGVSEWRARHAIRKLDVPPPRAGLVWLIPVEWLHSIRDALANDRRRKENKMRAKPRERLD